MKSGFLFYIVAMPNRMGRMWEGFTFKSVLPSCPIHLREDFQQTFKFEDMYLVIGM